MLRSVVILLALAGCTAAPPPPLQSVNDCTPPPGNFDAIVGALGISDPQLFCFAHDIIEAQENLIEQRRR